MYLAVNEASSGYNSSVFARRHENTNSAARGRLFRNDMDLPWGTQFSRSSDEAEPNMMGMDMQLPFVISIKTGGKTFMFQMISCPATFFI
jgi:hypothetical protein